jgi:hypothetical protein
MFEGTVMLLVSEMNIDVDAKVYDMYLNGIYSIFGFICYNVVDEYYQFYFVEKKLNKLPEHLLPTEGLQKAILSTAQ